MGKLRQRSKSVFIPTAGREPLFNNHHSENDGSSSEDEICKDSTDTEIFTENTTIKTESNLIQIKI